MSCALDVCVQVGMMGFELRDGCACQLLVPGEVLALPKGEGRGGGLINLA